MRMNKETILLARIRRLIREAYVWRYADAGMAEFWSTENYKRAKKIPYPVKGDYPYYCKSTRALEDIAKKILKEVKNANTETKSGRERE